MGNGERARGVSTGETETLERALWSVTGKVDIMKWKVKRSGMRHMEGWHHGTAGRGGRNCGTSAEVWLTE